MRVPDLDLRIERVREELSALPGRPDVIHGLSALDELERSDLPVWQRADTRNAVVTRLGHEGVHHHRYQLEPPVSEERVTAYEHRNGIRLPEDYRAFITRVANGGAGPSLYRLLPLDPERVDPQLHRPFPFRPDALPSRTWDDDKGFWEFDGSPFCPELWCGTIDLTDEGCTFARLLVVSGLHRGRIVHVDLERNGWPTFDPAPDFLTWYENWLFRRDAPTPWRDDVEAARLILDAGDDGAAQDAVRACFRLAAPYPLTSSSAVETLGAGVGGHAASRGRARAVWTLAHMSFLRQELAGARQLIGPALRDPDVAVRALAVCYADLDADALRDLLDDPSSQVVGAALVRLVQSDEHHLDVLRRLLGASSPAVRIAGAEAGLSAYRQHEWDRPGIAAIGPALGDLFLDAIDDPEPRVRVAAIVVLAVRDPDRALPALLAGSRDGDDEVRFRAVQALRRYIAGDPAVRARVQDLAAHDSSRAVRIEARSQLA
jgi:hypothetical protein